MDDVLAIILAVLPVIIVGVIALFVIKKMKHKSENGTPGRKKTKQAQEWMASLLPLGMLFGLLTGMAVSILFTVSFFYTISLGSGIGLLMGYVVYERYSRNEEESS